jgi:hypothetical protein
MGSHAANQRLIELTTREEHGEFYEDAGEALPLSVWASRGFDSEAIRLLTLPRDRKMHPVLGEVFKVSILKAGWRGNKSVEKTDRLTATAASSGSSSSGGPSPPLPAFMQAGPLALGDKSASDDSSSSSSSSRRHKKSKKSKKAKKSKKDGKRKRERSSGAADPGAMSSSSSLR